MTHVFLQLVVGATFVTGLMALLWAVQCRTKNAGIVDVAWAGSVGLLGAVFALSAGGDFVRRILVSTMIAVWSARLTVYLYRRVVGHAEEGRYAKLRAEWGGMADRRFFGFFMLQAAAALLFALPVLVVGWNRSPLGLAETASSLTLWALGMLGLAVADRQLARFKADPENTGKTCRAGWWRYSRHPNYFFEWVHWLSYIPLALGNAYWPIAVGVPVLLVYFIFYVTGIPPTEAQALRSRGEDYRRYQRTTSPFFPWFPKEDDQSW